MTCRDRVNCWSFGLKVKTVFVVEQGMSLADAVLWDVQRLQALEVQYRSETLVAKLFRCSTETVWQSTQSSVEVWYDQQLAYEEIEHDPSARQAFEEYYRSRTQSTEPSEEAEPESEPQTSETVVEEENWIF